MALSHAFGIHVGIIHHSSHSSRTVGLKYVWLGNGMDQLPPPLEVLSKGRRGEELFQEKNKDREDSFSFRKIPVPAEGGYGRPPGLYDPQFPPYANPMLI